MSAFPQDNPILPTGRLSQSWQRYLQTIQSQVKDVVAYTPLVSSTVGTIVSAIASARYQQIGKQVFLSGSVQVTGNGTGAGALLVTLPGGLYSPYQPAGSGTQSGAKAMQITLDGPLGPPGNTVLTEVSITNTDGTYPTVGPTTLFSIVYEVK